jgi:hypothetical protein
MHPVLASIPITAIIQPGHIYVLCTEKQNPFDPFPIDKLYVIPRDEDILPALEMEFCLVLTDWYELRHFIRCKEVLDDCYEFRFRCWDKAANKEVGYSLYLQRLSTFAEKLAWARKSITFP